MRSQLLKINQTLLLFVLLTLVLYYGKPLLIPFFFAIMLAMLMAPVCRKLDNKGSHRIVSCIVCILILVLVFAIIISILVGQISSFVGSISQFEQRTKELILSTHNYIEKQFHVPVAEQASFLQEQTQNISLFFKSYLTGLLRSSVQLLAGLVITLVLTFLMLLHKEKYYRFFLKFATGDSEETRKDMLNRIGSVAQHYLVGRAISIGALFILYAIALLIIGVKNALLLAAVAALFNIIPYLGPILAALFPVLVALVTEPSFQPALWVLITFCLFQALDNYFVTPYFLGGEVSLSAMATIVSMICGGFLWGVAGMILFIPLVSILKIIFDQVPGLQHYGQLIGDEGGRPTKNIKAWFKKIFARS